MLQMINRVADGHTLEVVDLATREDGGQYLVLLGGGEDEDDVCGRLFECLQKSIEGSGGEHVHLVDDEHLVASQLRRDARLLHERLDMLYGVVAGGIELEDVERALLIKRLARLACITGLALCCRVLTVDGFGEDTGASGLSYAPGTAEEVSVCQLTALHSVLQRRGQCRLSHDGVEGQRTVFPC